MFVAVGHALMMSFAMLWEILWAPIVGFSLSAVVQAVVSKEEMSCLLCEDFSRTIAIASGFGAASSGRPPELDTSHCSGPSLRR